VTVELAQAEDLEYPRGDPRGLAALLRKWEPEGWRGTGRTRAEIDADIEAERNSWGDD
jgi:hypothetical protein